jgi:fibronectin-binding autotransporter adhesin
MRRAEVSRLIVGLVVGFAVLMALPARGQVTWDADPATASPQDGPGTWSTSGTNWWNGAANVAWPNLTTSAALFGAGSGSAGTVTVSGSVTTNAITFNSAGSGSYTLTGGTIGLAGTTPTITANSSGSIGSILAGSAGLTKAGAGTLFLSGANTYSGTTTVSAGTLRLGSASALPSAASLAVTSTGTLDMNGFNATVASLAAGAATAKITNSVVGTGTLTVSGFNTSLSTLIEDGGLGQKVAVVVAGGQSIPNFANANNTFSGGLTISSVSVTTRLWNGAITTTLNGDGSIQSSNLGTGTVTIGTTTGGAQFALTAANTNVYNPFVFNAATYADGGFAAFRADSTGNVLHGQLTANLSPANFATGGTGAVTARGQITGSNGLRLKTSNITVTLSNTSASLNNYQGTTTVEALTTLSLAATDQIPNGASTGNVALDGTLRFNGFSDTINGLSGTGTVDGVSGTSTLSIGDNNATGTFSGAIRNSGVSAVLGLTKVGSGTLTLSGSNSYAGPTRVNAGTLLFDNVNTLYGGTTSSWTATNLTTGSGAVALFTTGSAGPQFTAANLTTILGMASTGSTGFLNGSTIGINSGSGTSLTYASAIANPNGGANALGLLKIGSGALVLSGSNSYSGATTISAGTFRVGSASALPAATALTVNSTGVLDLNGFNATVASLAAGAATAKITNSVVGTGTLTINAFSTTLSTLIEDGGAGQKVAVLMGGGQFTPNLANTNNTFSGGLTISSSASLTRLWNFTITTSLNGDGSIQSSNLGTGTVTIGTTTGNAQFALNSGSTSVYNPIVFNAAGYADGGLGAFRADSTGNVLYGQLTANLSPVSFSSGATGSVTARGQITGPNGLRLRTSNITVTLSNTSASANNYQGTTTVEASTVLSLAASDQLPNGGSAGNVAVAGTLRFNGFSDTINGLSGTGTVDGVSGTSTISIGDNSATSTFAGVLRNSGLNAVLGLSKIGSGTLTLSGSNTYSGPTDIVAGTLAVNGSVAGVMNVGNGATLAGAGLLNGLVTVAAGGVVAPGNSPGTLTMNSGLSLDAASILNFELSGSNFTVGDGVNDLIVVTGNFSLDGVLNVSAIGGGDFTAVPNGTAWRLFNYSGGTFASGGLSLNTLPSLGAGRSYQIDTSTTGRVDLIVVPEPGALALFGMGVVTVAWAGIRGRRQGR